MMILLFIITLGIDPIYWIGKFQMELKAKAGEGFESFGHFLMLIFTLGIYGIDWEWAAASVWKNSGPKTFLSHA